MQTVFRIFKLLNVFEIILNDREKSRIMTKLLLPFLIILTVAWLRERVRRPLVRVACDGGEMQDRWINDIEAMLSERSNDE